MIYRKTFSESDLALCRSLAGFVPKKVYDLHTHLYDPAHYSGRSWEERGLKERLDAREWKAALARNPVFKGKHVSALFFGLVAADSLPHEMNTFIREQLELTGDPLNRCLMVATPTCDPQTVAAELRSGRYQGIKVYHCYARREATLQAEIPEYAPEWMWEILNEAGGMMMLHLVLPRAVAEERNQREIRRLCRKYPRMKLVLAHAARCFSHRHAVGMAAVADLPNVHIDTSAVCEAATLEEALRRFGPHRVLYGSDYFISELRGRCVTMGETFKWLYDGEEATMIGIESLLALREAMNAFGATSGDVEDVFFNNAMRLLGIAEAGVPPEATPAEQWRKAREVISCGTGLLSKRAESFLTPQWPVRFSKAEGCRVWDTRGRMYRDFVGGVGAVFLGYADPDVNRAVGRRLAQGSYCSLPAGEEVALAERLLALHPGMGKVRYARGGGEAMALAVRIARAARKRSGVAFCGYHGWHDWYLAANLGYAPESFPVPGLNPLGVPERLAGTASAFHYNDVASLRRACAAQGENLAAIVMEPFRSQQPTPEFLHALRALLRETGAILVVDEVTSGLRYGFPGVSGAIGLPADLLVYAKAMSNGIPFGVVVGTDAAMQPAEASFLSSSYWTDGLGAAAALAVLEKMEREPVQPRIWARGVDFQKALAAGAARFPELCIEIDGMPVSIRLAYGTDENGVPGRVAEEMLQRGFLISKLIYLMDAHRDEDLADFLTAFGESLEVVAEAHRQGRIPAASLAAVPTIGRLA